MITAEAIQQKLRSEILNSIATKGLLPRDMRGNALCLLSGDPTSGSSNSLFDGIRGVASIENGEKYLCLSNFNPAICLVPGELSQKLRALVFQETAGMYPIVIERTYKLDFFAELPGSGAAAKAASPAPRKGAKKTLKATKAALPDPGKAAQKLLKQEMNERLSQSIVLVYKQQHPKRGASSKKVRYIEGGTKSAPIQPFLGQGIDPGLLAAAKASLNGGDSSLFEAYIKDPEGMMGLGNAIPFAFEEYRTTLPIPNDELLAVLAPSHLREDAIKFFPNVIHIEVKPVQEKTIMPSAEVEKYWPTRGANQLDFSRLASNPPVQPDISISLTGPNYVQALEELAKELAKTQKADCFATHIVRLPTERDVKYNLAQKEPRYLAIQRALEAEVKLAHESQTLDKGSQAASQSIGSSSAAAAVVSPASVGASASANASVSLAKSRSAKSEIDPDEKAKEEALMLEREAAVRETAAREAAAHTKTALNGNHLQQAARSIVSLQLMEDALKLRAAKRP